MRLSRLVLVVLLLLVLVPRLGGSGCSHYRHSQDNESHDKQWKFGRDENAVTGRSGAPAPIRGKEIRCR